MSQLSFDHRSANWLSWPNRAILLVALIGTGCSQAKPSYEMVPVTGVVQLDGKPLAGAQVVFDSDSTPPAYGHSDSTGQFTLMTRNYGDKVALGTYVVRVESTPDTTLAPSSKSVSIPPVYGESGVKVVEVTSGGANEFPLELKSRPGRSDYLTNNPLAEP